MEKSINENKAIKNDDLNTKDPLIFDTPLDTIKLPLPTQILAVLCILQCVISAPVANMYIKDFIEGLLNGELTNNSTSFIILYSIFLINMCIMIALLIAIGVSLLKNKRRTAAIHSSITAIVVAIAAASDVMISGITPVFGVLTLAIILLIVLKSYVDPSLSQERALQNKLRDMETKEAAEKGFLGFDKKEGIVKINFFNLFWLFTIMCFVGYLIEIAWHMTVDNPGVYQERAGLLFGPFSPIYGFGAIIITLCLNKLSNKNFLIVFVISALLGGFFEYFASLYLETCFGVRSWDYSHLPLNIDGRTCIWFFIIWGFIGVIWIKVLLKPFIRLINRIPWKLRYSVTFIATALMIINAIMTFQALDCWYTRNAGKEPSAPIEEFYANNFDDDFMHQRFENMKMNPDSAVRGSKQN